RPRRRADTTPGRDAASSSIPPPAEPTVCRNPLSGSGPRTPVRRTPRPRELVRRPSRGLCARAFCASAPLRHEPVVAPLWGSSPLGLESAPSRACLLRAALSPSSAIRAFLSEAMSSKAHVLESTCPRKHLALKAPGLKALAPEPMSHSGRRFVRDDEDPAIRQYRPVRPPGIGRPQPFPVLGLEATHHFGTGIGERAEVRAEAGALHPLQHRVVAGQDEQVRRLPRVQGATQAGQRVEIVLGIVARGRLERLPGQQRGPWWLGRELAQQAVARLAEV